MTILNLPVAAILHRETLFDEDFQNNMAGWEEADDMDEHCFIADSHYWMENRSEDRWMYYAMELKKGMPKNFVISAEIELLEHQGMGQFGLLWGFSKPHSVLNRFAVSVQHDRFSVLGFEKHHYRIHHRFSGPLRQQKPGRYRHISVMRLEGYLYFFLKADGHPVYICHESHLQLHGERFGFYIEPGIMVRADSLRVQRLVTAPGFHGADYLPGGLGWVNGN